MVGAIVGQVASLHRYPVKSMAGEDLDAATVTARGLVGDRGYALIDGNTGRVASAKHPRRWPGILGYRARFTAEPSPTAQLPPVVVTDPDGAALASGPGAALDAHLSGRFGRPVRLTNESPAEATFEYHWPDQPGLAYQGRLYRDEVTRHVMPPGTFFDSGILHLITTASLATLGQAVPGSRFEAGRFRPNVVIASDAAGFAENEWVDRVIRIGESVRIRIVKRCIRCVMVNLAQPGIEADGGILTASFRENEGHVGVKGDVLAPGPIRLGDSVRLE